MFKARTSFAVLHTLMALVAGSAIAAETNDELLVDPTVPLSISMAITTQTDSANSGLLDLLGTFSSYELSSVLVRGEDRIAVINGQRVRVGDSVGAARVTAIEPGRATLNVNGKIETVELYGTSIKTLVKGDE